MTIMVWQNDWLDTASTHLCEKDVLNSVGLNEADTLPSVWEWYDTNATVCVCVRILFDRKCEAPSY